MLKNKLRLSIIGIFALLLASCASTQNYQTILASWQGEDINDLIGQWGIPDNAYQLPNGDMVYIYMSNRELRYPAQFIPGSTSTRTSNGETTISSYPGVFVPGDTFDLKCTTIFKVGDNQLVKSISYKGNSCFATDSQMTQWLKQ